MRDISTNDHQYIEYRYIVKGRNWGARFLAFQLGHPGVEVADTQPDAVHACKSQAEPEMPEKPEEQSGAWVREGVLQLLAARLSAAAVSKSD